MVDSIQRVVDVKPYIRHHQRLGYEYVPGYDAELPQPRGGIYRLRINRQGIRSDRDYDARKPPGIKRRLLVFGDSFAAGQYIANAERFSELLERRHPGLEVINFGLEGTGTDQQLLLYEEVGQRFEHDAVALFPFLQNIRRNLVDSRAAIDPQSGQTVLIAKPRFVLRNGHLELTNVPVPADRPPAPQGLGADDQLSPGRSWKQVVSRYPGASWLKRQLARLWPWEPFPEYARPDTPAWRLMAAILEQFIAKASGKPFLLVPVFYVSYVRQKMARNYWVRFQSVADRHPQVRLVDLLPAFKTLGSAADTAFFEPEDCHWSPVGHVLVANVLSKELGLLGLLP